MRTIPLRAAIATILLALALPAARADDKLTAGDAAPALVPRTPIRGETPDLKTESGCVVVHFLVSNEKPSRDSVAVVNRLYKDLRTRGMQVIGIFDEDAEDVRKFAKPGTGAPEFPVASDRDGTSRRDWLAVAELRTLPQAFIIGRGGKILWIGSPLDSTFESNVRKAVTGRFDPPARERIDPAMKSAMKCVELRNWPEAYRHFDEAIEVDPVIAIDATKERYKTTLFREGKPDVANAWIVQTAKKRYSSDLTAIAEIVDLLLKDPEVKPRSPDTADKILDAATAKGGPQILSMRAQVAHARGDTAKAIELQTDAWMSAPPSDKPAFKRSLDEYRAAAKRQPAASTDVKRGS